MGHNITSALTRSNRDPCFLRRAPSMIAKVMANESEFIAAHKG